MGQKVTRVAVGDLNGDGKPDIVATDMTTKNVYVLLNQGDGTMMSAVPYSLGTPWPGSVAIGDFNGDHKADVAVSVSDGSIQVMLGNGDGTLQAPLSSASNISPVSLATADVNGDGKLDLLAGGNGSPALLYGNGDGTFAAAAPNIFTLPTGAVTGPVLVSGDLNGDGRPDLVVGLGIPTWVSVYLQQPNGTFSSPVTYKSTLVADGGVDGIFIQDVTGDSKPDLIVNSDAGLVIFPGNGDGTFGSAIPAGGSNYPTGFAVADFNGDGILDYANSNRNTTSPQDFFPPDNFAITVAPGKGDGNSDPGNLVQLELSDTAYAIAVADFDGDGLPDIVTANADHVSVVLNGTATAVANTANPNPQPPGQAVTFTTTVTKASGEPAPTGTISYFAGGLGVEPGHLLGTATLDGNGTATFDAGTFTALSVIQAQYSGDQNHRGSTAAPVTLQVGYATQTALAASANTVMPGASVSFTATVTSTTAAPTGTMTFYDGTTQLGTVALINGSAQFEQTLSTPGAHVIEARYRPDTAARNQFLIGSRMSTTVMVLYSTATTVEISGGTTAGSTITLKATVSATGAAPSGNVTFYDGTTSLGNASLSNGSASLTTSTIPAGTHAITAAYGGGTNFAGSTSAASPLTLTADFAFKTTTAPALTINAGQSGSTTVTITPQPGGFTSPIQLSCTGAPALSTCSVSPSTITPGTGNTDVTVTVSTTATTASNTSSTLNGLFYAMMLPIGAFGFICRKSTKVRVTGCLMIAMIALMLSTGCGGGSNSNTTPTPKPGTTPGTYTLTLNATSGTITHSTAIALTVK